MSVSSYIGGILIGNVSFSTSSFGVANLKNKWKPTCCRMNCVRHWLE